MPQSQGRSLAEDLGFLLSRSGGILAGAVNKELVSLGLKVRSYSVLALACEAPEGVNQRSVAATMGLDPSQIVGLVDDLEERGLVERTAAPADRRNKLIVATDEGRELHADACARAARVEDGYFDHLPSEVLDQLREGLQHIVFPESTT
ncbi:MarR family transcriptional regulator [Saccharopolyspora terrae]|uniref:MarR family transcriptional regulator n=1 Tax=Saccharopolyspora terrae TaxID=2530384 RepID=A0A4R4VDA3_9PSEU|nr:MarR family winged helix-turn-helix transcriptional regulator [Saccharopolyspora terrae]TDD02791.1 MarR family transcriptional regulator [Saccharopolyspora terrae]